MNDAADGGERFEALERELQASRDSLRLALEAGRMGTWTWDIASDRVVWDDLMRELFALSDAPQSFQAWLDRMEPTVREETRELVDTAVRTGTGYRILRNVVSDPGLRWVESRADVIRDEKGNVVGLRGLTIDVTEREEARRHAERLAADSDLLSRAVGVLASSLDPEQVLRRVNEIVVPEVADACEIATLEPGGTIRRYVHADGIDNDRIRRRERRTLELDDDHPIADVVRTGRPRRLDMREPGDRSQFGSADDDTTAASFALRQVLIVPMVVRGEVVGALAFGRREGAADLDAESVALASRLASRLALCYDNALLFSRQRTIADTLQRSLVPQQLPTLDWLELAGRYWVPGEGIEVGGDFYDAIVAEGSDTATLLIGDVCGKGVEAAGLTALARHTLRTALHHVDDRSTALVWLHEAIRSQAPESFITVVACALRSAGETVAGEVVNGGHPRPIIVRADGSTDAIESAGTPPGLPVWKAAPPERFTLWPGDALVLYTDGVTDVPGDAALTAAEVAAMLAPLRGMDAEAMASRIGELLDELRPFRHRADDIAVLVARVPA